MNRCNFIEAASCGALPMGTLPSVSHVAAENRSPIPGLLGMLYDSVLRVGRRVCVTKCQDINFPERNPQGEQIWSDDDKLSPYIDNIIQMWTGDAGVSKDQEENGYAYIKKQYMHCVDPNCVSVYPVSALKKDPKTGIVHYDKDVYTGCRYRMIAYPYNVPEYDCNNPFGALHKRELCSQEDVERLDKNGLPNCAEVCPAGAVISGTREELIAETKKCLALKPGSEYHYLRQTLKSGDTYLHTVPRYHPHLYGEKEGSGTQVLVLTGVSYEDPDLPRLDNLSTGARSESIQRTLYKGMMLPLAVLAGLTMLIRRDTKNDHHDRGDDHRL